VVRQLAACKNLTLTLTIASQRSRALRGKEEGLTMDELEELTLPDIYLLLESLEYSRMNITHGTAPNEVKQPKLRHLESVMAKLRALRDDMRRNP